MSVPFKAVAAVAKTDPERRCGRGAMNAKSLGKGSRGGKYDPKPNKDG